MRAPQLGAAAKTVGPVTGPGIISRIYNHPRPNRVQLDIAKAREEVAISLNNAGLKPPLKQCTCALIGLIEVAHIEAAYILHRL